MDRNSHRYTFNGLTGVTDERVLRSHYTPINNIRFSPDGKYVASGDDSGLLVVGRFRYESQAMSLLTS